jgi:hypothetical protein
MGAWTSTTVSREWEAKIFKREEERKKPDYGI